MADVSMIPPPAKEPTPSSGIFSEVTFHIVVSEQLPQEIATEV
jgi:hypothetical protein